ncbi:MAG TPA: beta-propeller fold lactonase family protein [Solirubrobacterales bacterium]|nr:beta-propeller fold lactonase family protein [Solirubrobacterales bacterium]
MTTRSFHRTALGLLAILALLAMPALASATKKGGREHVQPPTVSTQLGNLKQLPGRLGCVADGPAAKSVCGRARALKGPGPGVGSRAIAISPDGRSVYVASSRSDAIAIFTRDPSTGALRQLPGKAGCVAALVAKGKATGRCGLAIGLIGPNSVAVSPDGRSVYATSHEGSSVTTFHRNRLTGALTQLPPSASGCISGLPIPTCTAGRAVKGPDVVVVSPDGKNVYVGAFDGNAVVSFSRAAGSGALTQLSGSGGCIANGGGEGCAAGVELERVEGLAISPSGSSVYAAAAFSSAVDVLSRNASTGALSQATDGSGCITNSAVAGCTQGYQIGGVNALVVAPKSGDVYATSLTSNSLTTFHPTEGGGLAQPARPSGENIPPGLGNPSGCAVFLRSPGCSFAVAMQAPEGLALSPAGTNVYVTAFETGAIDVFDRSLKTGTVAQKPGEDGCLAPRRVAAFCARGRALGATGSVVVSPDGRNVYSTAWKSNAVDIFRRIR